MMNMMNWGGNWDWSTMMGGVGSDFRLFGLLNFLLIEVILVLLAVWLWQQVTKKR